ncbi:MAG: extracellular solute-binding protein [bacterium]
MKKILGLTILGLSVIALAGCSSKTKLYILNWQEYISEDLIEEFEDEFNVQVVERNLVSNELMYGDLKMKTADYDVVFPSDYMIEKLSNENLIIELDPTKLPNLYKDDNTRIDYTTGLETYIEGCGYEDYFVPYFWGSLGIMYKTVDGDTSIEDTVKSQEWGVFFNDTGYKTAMYDVSRDAYAAAQMYLGYDLNNYTTEQLKECTTLLKDFNYDVWGTDDIKGRISRGAIDIGLVYSGDFFDQLYADDYVGNYNIYIPDTNNVFFDAMCIPTISKNQDLAYEFINFMIDKENSIENASYVGYCPVFNDVYEAVMADEEMNDVTEYPAWNPAHITNGTVYRDLGTSKYNEMEEEFKKTK